MKATHRGEYAGIAATNRAVEFTALVVDRIHEGKIAAPQYVKVPASDLHLTSVWLNIAKT